jgi:hypothetical protein
MVAMYPATSSAFIASILRCTTSTALIDGTVLILVSSGAAFWQPTSPITRRQSAKAERSKTDTETEDRVEALDMNIFSSIWNSDQHASSIVQFGSAK